ncbi:MAG: chloride channel protein [Clostridia bacterium]|nr:chloride channel protein [Clostridia bacterium]
MKSRLLNHIKNLLLPCLVFSVLAGFFSAIIITVFKILAEWVVHLSVSIYADVRENPEWLALLILGAALIGLIASLILSRSSSCMGGGIPTSVAAIRGIASFKWVATLILLPFAALLTYLAGLPLGTEGPCVQMGTAVGDGISRCGGDKNRSWRRYVMTGGAATGFSIATVSPISAIIFSMEELHKRFSPLLLSVASISVMTAQLTIHALASVGIGGVEFFHMSTLSALSPTHFFAPIIVGITAGAASILFTRLYHYAGRLMRLLLKRIPTVIVFPALFATTATVGFFLAESLGSGHSLVDALLTGGAAWYILILVFLIRAIGMMTSNTAGVTGGIFLPTLAFGAIVGALVGEGLVALGWIGGEHYPLMVVLGIASFLGSTSRIPLTACVFAIEALAGINNTLYVIIATFIALVIVEASGCEDFTDTVIEAKMHKLTKGKIAHTVEVGLTVKEGSFAVGNDISNLLLPNSCVIVSYNRNEEATASSGIAEGDVIHVHYTTYTPEETQYELYALVGTQSDDVARLMVP